MDDVMMIAFVIFVMVDSPLYNVDFAHFITDICRMYGIANPFFIRLSLFSSDFLPSKYK